MTNASPSPFRVRQMRVIWRDTFVVEGAPGRFLDESHARLARLPITLADTRSDPADQPEALRVVERVSRSVAKIGYPNLLRVQLAPFHLASLRPTLDRVRTSPDRLTEAQIGEAAREADAWGAWIAVTPMLLLHRAGVGIMEYHVNLTRPQGFTPEEAIDRVRMGIQSQLLRLDDGWRSLLPDGAAEWPVQHVVPTGPGQHVIAAGLRDLSQGILAARLGMAIQRRPPARRRAAGGTILPPRPVGSASVVLVEVEPKPGADFAAYAAEHGRELRGIGSMDLDYRNRAGWLVRRELADDLSTDAEMAFYLLGNSELMVFNDGLKEAIAFNRKHLRLKSDEHAITYFYMHYVVLMEWVYLQEAILRAYLQRLDALAASAAPHRRRMISTLQHALGDLVQYQETITPYANRVEFLERAHAYHKLDQLAERFERKQELLLNYASEYHDYREARATEFLNWLAGILTGAALGNLIITLAGIQPDQTAAYLGITLGSVALVLAVMAFLLRRV